MKLAPEAASHAACSGDLLQDYWRNRRCSFADRVIAACLWDWRWTFEPATPRPERGRATRLRYAPLLVARKRPKAPQAFEKKLGDGGRCRDRTYDLSRVKRTLSR